MFNLQKCLIKVFLNLKHYRSSSYYLKLIIISLDLSYFVFVKHQTHQNPLFLLNPLSYRLNYLFDHPYFLYYNDKSEQNVQLFSYIRFKRHKEGNRN